MLISKFVKGGSHRYSDKIAETGMMLYLQVGGGAGGVAGAGARWSLCVLGQAARAGCCS